MTIFVISFLTLIEKCSITIQNISVLKIIRRISEQQFFTLKSKNEIQNEI